MNPLLYPLFGAMLGLVFVASLSRRQPVRLPRRFAEPGEEGRTRSVHRGIVIHITLGLSCVAAILPAGELNTRPLLFLFGLILLSRILGEQVGRMHPRLSRILSPLLAPIDGAALLIDWIVSLILPAGDRGARRLGSQDAYDHVFELEQRTVETVMTPRSEMTWLKAESSLSEITEAIKHRPHARYPVIDGDFEQFVGTVELLDLLEPVDPSMTAAQLARPGVAVPETIGCDDLLVRMRADRFGTAIVVDEFGGIAGLVTLEDLLEVLVGELVGEHEAVEVRSRRVGENTFLVDGTVRIDEFEELFGIELPQGDYETIAGLFLSRVVRIPTRGERVTLGNLRLEVIDADSHRIRKLKLEFAPSSSVSSPKGG